MRRSDPNVAVYGHHGPFGLITTTNQQLQSIAPRRARKIQDTATHIYSLHWQQ
jgi:hypothetical protein